MITLRRSEDRGHAQHGWLESRHTFSFADYHDPKAMGFRALRVINEDVVQAGRGFGTHSHRDMEVISYALSGALEHKDSLGTGATIRPGEVQRMTAGTGVSHSEFNASSAEPVHFLQIWILPERRGLTPSYEQRRYDDVEKRGKLRLVASRDGTDGSVTVHQDVRLLAGLFDGAESATYPLGAGRHAWVHVARGSLSVNGRHLSAGDALALSDEPSVTLGEGTAAEVLLFDLG